MAGKKKGAQGATAASRLEMLVNQAMDVVKKAMRHKKSLAGDNFYGNKLVELRAEATNTFRELSPGNSGDVVAMAEMINDVFSAATNAKERRRLAQEMVFALRTTWRGETSPRVADELGSLFPMTLLVATKRGYLVSIGRQINSCFASGCYDACAVMMRRLLEICLIEAFEAQGVAASIKNADGTYVQLSDLIKAALAEKCWTLSRNTMKALPKLRDVGHMSAHGRYFCAQKGDIESLQQGCRIVIEEFLRHARLL